MTVKLEFKDENNAIDALDNFFGPMLIELSEVNFVAIIKNDKNNYEIKVGKEDGKPLKLITPIERFINSNKSIAKNNNLFEKFNRKEFQTSEINTIKAAPFTIRYKEILNDGKNSLEKPSPFLKGGISIGNKEVHGGTLGGIFQIDGFPNDFFGISNWHVLGYKTCLGDSIFQPGIPHLRKNSPGNYKCGSLFWKCIDAEREVAFVHFNTNRIKKISPIDACGYKLSGNISSPLFGENTRKCGKGTSSNYYSKGSDKKKVYSNRAFVKIFDYSIAVDGRHSRVFKNQILVENFTEDGDSGSILINDNGDVIGLIMGETKCSNYTVANNINNIFNIQIPDCELPVINGTKIPLSNFCLKKFI